MLRARRVLFALMVASLWSSVALAVDGAGTMVVTPTTIVAGAVTNFVFTFTASGSFASGSQITLQVPIGWTVPTTSNGAGQVQIGTKTCTAATFGTISANLVPVNITCASGQTVQVKYNSATRTDDATYPFTTKSKIAGGTLTALAVSPTVSVTGGDDGAGTMTVNPTSASAGSTGNIFTFTFTSPGNFNASSKITLVVPVGWTAPTATAGAAGMIQVATGTCGAATLGTITGTGPWTVPVTVTCSTSGQALTVTYGAGTSATKVTAPVTTGPSTFVTSSAITGGTLIAIASSPVLTANPGPATQVRVETAANGSGTIVPAQSLSSGTAITGYAISRDASNNFVANVASAWSLASATGGVVAGDLVASGDTKSAAFTGHVIGTAQVHAVSGALTTTNSGMLTVVVGSATAVRVETAANGSGTVVPAQSVTSGAALTGYAISRDGSNNFVANVAGTWSLASGTGGVVAGDLVPSGDTKSAAFTGHLMGTAQVHAVSGALTPTNSGTVTVVVGSAAAVRVETAADGSGTVVPAQSLASGAAITGFAISRDGSNNFVANVTSTWSLASATGGVVAGDLVASGDTKSAVFNGHVIGTAQVHAVNGALTSTNSGTLTVVPGSATSVAFTTQPSGGTANVAFSTQPVVTIRDASGNALTSGADATATISLALVAGGGMLSGTTSMAAVASVANFSGKGLTIDVAGAGKQLQATKADMTGSGGVGPLNVTSSSFTITARSTATVVNCAPSSVAVNDPTTCTATVTDTSGTGALTPTGTVTFTTGGAGTFTPLTSCTLSAGSCAVTYTPTAVGTGSHAINGSYGGDSSHAGSTTTPLTVTVTPVKVTPVITWANPADIGAGTALSATQLNATADVAGTFLYTPPSGTVLNAGPGQNLHVAFTPTDTATYNTASKDLTINVGNRVQYFYDDLGRLIAVVAPSGDTAGYHYDAVGNILSIDRHSSTQVSILSFSPVSGPAGSTVTIHGTGFSATASQDTVTFNGVAGSLSGANTTQLVVTVPAGATTGTIAVTAPGGSATSSMPFTVTTAAPVPTITSFTPSIGVPGTSVTVTGTSFDPVIANNRVQFDGMGASLSSSTSTTISTAVPQNSTSGRISVSTPAGNAVSTADFFVPTGTYTASSVQYTGRMAVGDTLAIPLPTAGKIGLVVFEGIAGQRVSLKATNPATFSTYVTIFTPTGSSLATMLAGAPGGLIEATALPVSGTYTILVDPTAYSGTLTIALYNVVDQTGTLTSGTGFPYNLSTPSQNARLTFSGTAGQRATVTATASPWWVSYHISILNPDGSTLTTAYVSDFTYLDAVTLSTTGVYTVLLDPNGWDALSGAVTATVFNDVTGSITAGGAGVMFSTSTPGQAGRYTFTGNVGQRLSLQMSNSTIGGPVVISILKPDGSTLASSTSTYIDVQTLGLAGTYTAMVDPTWMFTGSASITLYDVPADLSGSVTVNGSAVAVPIGTPGQNAAYTFSGTSGQLITVHITGNTIGGVAVSLLNPDGSTLTSSNLSGSFNLAQQTLPSTGTYTVTLNPTGTNVGTLNLSATNP